MLVQALIKAGEPLPMAKLAASVGMTTSKARAYLISLKRIGLVIQTSDAGPYELGPMALSLGIEALRRIDAMQTAKRLMQELDRTTRLPLVLTMWNGDHATIIEQNESADDFPVAFRVGRPLLSLTRSASGLVYLAYLPASSTAELVRKELHENTRYDDTRHITATYLSKQVALVRKQGFSVVDGIRVSSRVVLDGYSAIGMPVMDPVRKRCFTITMFFDRHCTDDYRDKLFSLVKDVLAQALPARPFDEEG